MKFQEIMKAKRRYLKLTQEDIANALGVSTPAVNKWEKGISYPDITLLPALARLLETDLNTLLSYQEDLSENEIGVFLNDLSAMTDTSEFDDVYQKAMQKIREFPNCYLLLVSTAAVLDGMLVMSSVHETVRAEAEKNIEKLYERALASDQPQVVAQAQQMLISRYMNRHEYEKAKSMLNEIPDRLSIDKKQLQANLYAAQGQYAKAASMLEEKLLVTIQEMQSLLSTLMNLALKENRKPDALYIAETSKAAAEIFHQWEYTSYIAHFEYYVKCQDVKHTLEILPHLLTSIRRPWNMKGNPLYQHLKTKDLDTGFQEAMQKNIIEALLHDEETAFLREQDAFFEIVNQYC